MILILLSLLIAIVNCQSFPQPNPCFRWSGQIAIANSPSGGNSTSTLYYYGGEAITQTGQTSQFWNNALVSIDISKSWSTGSPPTALISPDTAAAGNYISPPAVALGALWSDGGNFLYQYGGEFSDTPNVNPPVQSIFQYNIAQGNWSVVPTTGDVIGRVAEGSAAIVDGRIGYYFSGHQDDHTTQGWSNQTPRQYLSSMITFDLNTHTVRNISSYSSNAASSNTSSPEINPVYRADGTLTYVPGVGSNGSGILVAIGGATSTQYVDNSVLDVFDIGTGGWTKQPTLGNTIGSRVNHCAVLASAVVNGVQTHDIYVYGGQQLGNVSNRDSALYILSLPSYTWTLIGNSLPSEPVGRAGHQCALSGSQLIVVGGVVSSSIICDSPGVYIFDVSKTQWTNSYTAGTTYTTPSILSSIVGTTNSTSPNSTTIQNTPSQSSSSNQSSSSVNIGGIVGGVIGGIILLLLLLGLLFFLLRRKRRNRDELEKNSNAAENRRSGLFGGVRTDSDSSDGGTHEKSRPNSDWRNSRASNEHYFSTPHASDDVEETSRNMEASFGSHLVPKQPLRVMFPEQVQQLLLL